MRRHGRGNRARSGLARAEIAVVYSLAQKKPFETVRHSSMSPTRSVTTSWVSATVTGAKKGPVSRRRRQRSLNLYEPGLLVPAGTNLPRRSPVALAHLMRPAAFIRHSAAAKAK